MLTLSVEVRGLSYHLSKSDNSLPWKPDGGPTAAISSAMAPQNVPEKKFASEK